ncbi:MAG: hypothetical protein IJT05_08085 [Lachnospiraceae bacterium]|nr:hypothetical protein [Lachnospiraceae bacterium]
MSQAKVEQHKQEKKNRTKLIRKEKTARVLTGLLGFVLIAAIGVWIGVSVYHMQMKKAAENIVYTDVNMSALSDYEASLGE